MKFVFVSNYYNHHQSEFSEIMYKMTNGNYTFIETIPMENERKDLGWSLSRLPVFVKKTYQSQSEYNKCLEEINEADVLIYGSAPFSLVENRLKKGKLVFKYSERWYKEKFIWWKWPKLLVRHFFSDRRFRNLYILCASAYTAYDCKKTFLYHNKAFKWGYFPALKRYENIDTLINEKKKASILWTGRLIDWKHPELPVIVAEKLRDEGYSFTVDIIGTGVLSDYIKDMIGEKNLQNYVHMLGSLTPDEVRRKMEFSSIFLFTSDRKEGWGAVLNESMNSGCAVVASHAAGAVPYLINDGDNGFIYKSDDLNSLYSKVKYLLDNPDEQKRIGKASYKTITKDWNAETASKRLINLSECILNRKKAINLYDSGPCSQSEIISDYWF